MIELMVLFGVKTQLGFLAGNHAEWPANLGFCIVFANEQLKSLTIS
jgi:hypothetical protein